MKRCYGCMELTMDENGKCKKCGFDINSYHVSPRCLIPGTRLNERYTIGKVLGEGGFSITYIGWDNVLGLPVAIKEYFPLNTASRDASKGQEIYVLEGNSGEVYEKGLKRCIKEVKSLSKFHDMAGIVSIRDFFYANHTAYIIMEYLQGITLKEYVKERGVIKPEQVFILMKPILFSLGKMHTGGMIHRDISPDNIMVTVDGKVKLIDFGAAKITDNVDKSYTVFAKRGYTPEEQYRSNGNQGPWSDVYAVCCSIYYMITGKVPPEALERAIQDNLESFGTLGIYVSENKANAIYKGMSVFSKDRYHSIKELCEDLYGKETEPVQNIITSVSDKESEKKPEKPEKQKDDINSIADNPTELIKTDVDKEDASFTQTEVISKKSIEVLDKEKNEVNKSIEINEENSFSFSDSADRKFSKKYFIVPIAAVIITAAIISGIFFKGGKVEQNSQTKEVEKNFGKSRVKEVVTDTPAVTKKPIATKKPVTYKIANVVGMSAKKAVTKLKSSGDKALSVKKQYSYNKKVKKGYVISQNVKGGTEYQEGKAPTVTIKISKGEEKVTVPYVINRTKTSAIKVLKKKKLKYRIGNYVYSDNYSRGVVVSQSIKKGNKVKKGTVITLSISLGKKKAEPTSRPVVRSTPKPAVRQTVKPQKVKPKVSATKRPDPFSEQKRPNPFE